MDKRLIDAGELLSKLNPSYKDTVNLIQAGEPHLDSLAEGYTEVHDLIISSPYVDAVEVVRCKDCKYFQSETMIENIKYGNHCSLVDSVNVHGYRNGEVSYDSTLLWRNEDDFCSRGERKEE